MKDESSKKELQAERIKTLWLVKKIDELQEALEVQKSNTSFWVDLWGKTNLQKMALVGKNAELEAQNKKLIEFVEGVAESNSSFTFIHAKKLVETATQLLKEIKE